MSHNIACCLMNPPVRCGLTDYKQKGEHRFSQFSLVIDSNLANI